MWCSTAEPPFHPSPLRLPLWRPVLRGQEFIKRNGQFTVNVGLCEAGVPILGVVGVPAADEPRTYFAVKGEGAFVEVRIVGDDRGRCGGGGGCDACGNEGGGVHVAVAVVTLTSLLPLRQNPSC